MSIVYEEVVSIVESLLLNHFDIQADQLDWEKPLEELHEDFRILDSQVKLEQLLQKELGQGISLLEKISTAFHTPQNIVTVVMQQLKEKT